MNLTARAGEELYAIGAMEGHAFELIECAGGDLGQITDITQRRLAMEEERPESAGRASVLRKR